MIYKLHEIYSHSDCGDIWIHKKSTTFLSNVSTQSVTQFSWIHHWVDYWSSNGYFSKKIVIELDIFDMSFSSQKVLIFTMLFCRQDEVHNSWHFVNSLYALALIAVNKLRETFHEGPEYCKKFTSSTSRFLWKIFRQIDPNVEWQLFC